LGHRDKRYFTLLKKLHGLDKVDETAGEAVDFINRHHIHLPCFNVTQKPLECWPIGIFPAEAAIIIVVRKSHPVFPALALDISLNGLSLRVNGIELLLQAIVIGYPAIDGDADSRLRGIDT
jgi:hypothetical protein